MGKKYIITENQYKLILEQDTSKSKENEFLKKYIGKTFNLYHDDKLSKLSGPTKIESIEYVDNQIKGNKYFKGILINYENDGNYNYIECLYNPGRLGYKIFWEATFAKIPVSSVRYNKSLVDDINTKGIQAGIQWCKKPSADFGGTQKPGNNKIV